MRPCQTASNIPAFGLRTTTKWRTPACHARADARAHPAVDARQLPGHVGNRAKHCLIWHMHAMHAQTRVRILRKIAEDLESHEALIMERNGRDVAAAERRKIDANLLQRLRLRPEKIRTLARGIRAIADQDEPLRRVRHLSCIVARDVSDRRCSARAS